MKDSEVTSQSLELFTEIAEVVIDSLMQDGLLKDIPFLSLAVKVANIGKTVTDRIFLTKIKKLINNTNDNDFLGNLIGSGLTEVSSTGIIISGYDVVHNSVHISALGKLFVRLMNDKN